MINSTELKDEEELHGLANGAKEILVKAAEEENRKQELYRHTSHSRSVDRHERSLMPSYNDTGSSKAYSTPRQASHLNFHLIGSIPIQLAPYGLR